MTPKGFAALFVTPSLLVRQQGPGRVRSSLTKKVGVARALDALALDQVGFAIMPADSKSVASALIPQTR